jgi:26S proteasome regulatory subunit N6|tara:strand:- start:398 stop:1741 length:1344 start_codon:yes stop_codon:yes gene_type:complete|mmetsp:Transcript_14272/g.37827  ORF Transcript_14272/g.37827 Transcript_14272/m.37827 type:complete len:448 (-) Transcript_14272:28-1371(-)
MDALQATAMDLDDAAEAPPDPLEVAFEAAANASDPGAAYLAVLTDAEHALTEAGARAKEQCVYKLAERDSKNKNFGDVAVLLERAAPFFGQVAKAKVAKIVRKLLDIVAAHADTLDLQAELCLKVVAWCRAEKRTFLRQRVEARLVQIDFERARYDDALGLVTRLLRELKQLDDKQMLVETHLVEAKIHGALRNVPKAKAALTAARTNGNAVYVGPRLQAELDEMSGSLHCEEQDYHTAHSYFLEAYEAYDTLPDRESDATRCLKYMLLCQILQEPLKGSARGADALLDAATAAATSAQYVKYAGPNLDSMAAVARAAKARSLAQFEACTAKYGAQLRSDLLIAHHLDLLYDRILEKNLGRIIEPFSRVEIARVAELIGLPVAKVEKKLAQMVLDKKLRGVLAQGEGQLILHAELAGDATHDGALDVIRNVSDVVESLFARAKALDV